MLPGIFVEISVLFDMTFDVRQDNVIQLVVAHNIIHLHTKEAVAKRCSVKNC